MAYMKNILILNGPNLNLLGMREPGVYGTDSYDQICELIAQHAEAQGLNVDFYQSNSEGGIIDRLHQCVGSVDGVILNAGAYTHTSYSLRDAISAIGLPVTSTPGRSFAINRLFLQYVAGRLPALVFQAIF